MWKQRGASGNRGDHPAELLALGTVDVVAVLCILGCSTQEHPPDCDDRKSPFSRQCQMPPTESQHWAGGMVDSWGLPKGSGRSPSCLVSKAVPVPVSSGMCDMPRARVACRLSEGQVTEEGCPLKSPSQPQCGFQC